MGQNGPYLSMSTPISITYITGYDYLIKLGSHVAVEGKTKMIAKTTTTARIKGNTPLYIIPIGICGATPLRVNRLIPTGGVLALKTMFITISTANHIGFNPMDRATGYIMGTPTRIRGKAPIKKPRIKKKKRIRAIKPPGDRLNPVIRSVITLERLHHAINLENITAPISTIKTMEAVFPDSTSACKKVLNVNRLRIIPMISAPTTPIAPPSVGVNIPE